MDQAVSHRRARTRGANPVLYWVVRALVELPIRFYFRTARLGREHIPAHGPAIIAANHRSFIDPWVIGTMARRPVYYVAKSELFANPVIARLITALGAFPVRRGEGDGEAIQTARQLLESGQLVLIFPEGTRTRPGPLGVPRRGVARLALETGAPVIPLAIIGTDAVRRGLILRPRRIRARAGLPLRLPRVPEASPALAAAALEHIWRRVELQWEWLGGQPRRQQATDPRPARVG